jgi:hypothetical protein
VKIRLIAYLTVLTLLIFLPTVPVNAVVKAGASCKTLGLTSVASGKTYTCVKSGKKLVWKLQPKGANPSPRSSTIASIETKYWSSPSHYELVNVNADLTRVFIIFEEKELRYQLTKWGMDARLFVYAIAGGEQLLTVEPLKDIFQYAVNGKLLLSLWKKNVLDGALLKIAVGPLFMDKTIEFGSLIEAGALKSSLVPEKNWLLETRVDTSKITRTLGANPLPTQTPVPTQTPEKNNTLEIFGRAPYFTLEKEGQNITLLIDEADSSLYRNLGYSAKGFVAKAKDSSGKEFVSKELMCRSILCQDLRFNFLGLYGDVWQFSVAPILESGRGRWSKPITYSISKGQRLFPGDPNPIDGKYLPGDIGPAGGRIFLTPEYVQRYLNGWTVESAQTPQGFYYEIAPLRITGDYYGIACAMKLAGVPEPGVGERLSPISKSLSDSDGLKNTNLIVESGLCVKDSIPYRARALSVNGFQDWFIPSSRELRAYRTFTGFGWSLFEIFGRTGEYPNECTMFDPLNPDGRLYTINALNQTKTSSFYEEVSGLLCAVRKFRP